MGDSYLLRIKGGWNIHNVELESNTGLVEETGVGAYISHHITIYNHHYWYYNHYYYKSAIYHVFFHRDDKPVIII